MMNTNVFQKLMSSVIVVLIVFVVTSPILLLHPTFSIMTMVWIGTFFIYNLFFIAFFKNRDVGMIAMKTYWKEDYPVLNQVIFAILYTASFSTLFFHIWFPLDLFLINIIIIQLPCVLLTGTTLHGYLSGNMVTAIKES